MGLEPPGNPQPHDIMPRPWQDGSVHPTHLGRALWSAQALLQILILAYGSHPQSISPPHNPTHDRKSITNTHSQALISLSLFLSLYHDLDRAFLRENCVNSGPLGSVFKGKNRSLTVWANMHDLVAEWVQLAPFAPLRPNCLQPSLSPLS